MLPIDNSTYGSLSSSSLLPGGGTAAIGASAVKDTFLDQNSLNSVKAMGRKNDPQALKEIAKKFEGMFVQQMLKSMREANEAFSDGSLFSSKEEKFHQDMLDQQMVLNLTSGKGIGLATSMYQQMQKIYGKVSADKTDAEAGIKPLVPTLKPLTQSAISTVPPALISRAAITANINKNAPAQTPQEFIASLMPFAEKAAAELNVNTDVILAQAALETGWGKHLLRDKEGNSSFNVFNIKKNASWEGKSVSVNSLEYREGVAKKERSEFRQYEGLMHSFSDYVDLLKNSPRFKHVLTAGNNSASCAEALQKAGYATDPDYAKKIKRLLNSDTIRSAVDGSMMAARATITTRG